jgi:hypothetical protein
MTTTQRVNLVRNAEEHIRALTAVIDLLVQSPDCQHELVVISRALSRLAFRAQPPANSPSERFTQMLAKYCNDSCRRITHSHQRHCWDWLTT